ncbi:MAG TPA: hypothetical protein VHC90_00990 [Bryobacteraceae bacterium]|nr:hypothetical protein [Bryobacteraceae bacterium]
MKWFALPAALLAVSLVWSADVPSGETLIQRCIDKEGGAKAMDRAQTVVMSGTVEIVGRNIAGPFEIDQQGEKSYTKVDLPGIGKVEEGFDGTTAWESNLLQGTRIKEGDELEATRRASRVSILGDWKDYYKSAITKGEADVNGKPAWQVEMTPTKGSSVEEFYFDRESGLLVKMTQTLPTSLGDIPVEMGLGDYRPIDGILTPFTMSQSAMGQNMAFHIDKVSYSAKIPSATFDLPPAVKELMAKKKP